MTQPTERRFVMEPRLDAEVATLNTAISAEATARTNADATKVAKAGDTMTGALVLSGDPTLAMHAATKQYVDAGDAALQAGINDVKQTSRVYVKNGASSLTKGTPVYITGADGTNVIIGAASNASEATSSKVIGLTETDLTANAMGYVVTDGKLTNIDTSGAAAAGDAVWLGVNGAKVYGLANKPVAPAHMVYLGVVSRKNANTGEIEVKVQNGFELDELHNVLISSPANGQALTYDSATQLWKNATPASTLDALTDVTINSGTLAGGQVIKYDAGATQWVNGAAAGGVTAAATAPNLATSAAGDAWFDTNDGTLYVCYVDVDSTKQWVQVQANSALEASILSRLGALESTTVAFGNLSPNYIINGAMDVWQRGTSFSNPADGSYVADRWVLNHNGTGATRTISQQAFTPGAAPVSGYEGTYFLRYDTSVVGTGNTYQVISQRIEDARTLAGQTATISFWAKGSASRSCFVQAAQVFNGGSATVYTVAGTANVTTSWQRFSFTISVPSVSGKTINAGSYLAIELHAGGAASGQLDIWGVQLERGTTATAFRRNAPSIQAELAACQRYYYRWTSLGTDEPCFCTGIQITSTTARMFFNMPVEMRTTPTSAYQSNMLLSDQTTASGVLSSFSLIRSTPKSVQFLIASSGLSFPTRIPVAFVTLTLGGYVEINAEL